MSRYQKGKTNLDFSEARDSEWQWNQLGWAICKSAPCSRQITTPAPHQSCFLQAGHSVSQHVQRLVTSSAQTNSAPLVLRRHGLNDAALRHVYILSSLVRRTQWCIAKNESGYTQTGVAKGLKVPCLFMIAEVSIRCQKNPEVGIRRIPAYTPPIHHWTYAASAWGPFTTEASDRQRTNPAPWILLAGYTNV